ncbi:zinc ribbon domain-containing protein [Deinococcus ficus]|uniref:zinc ribbon domain-containing protein n=1 Tax=Deinococcus ficus TaxID=317577 RepID=UPI00174D03D5|nr:zinc ribbon domain-containing protein [Deinococcus ficus]GHF88552.1 hypothetical protein GCM10017782_27200 [Deinococcus ficus]
MLQVPRLVQRPRSFESLCGLQARYLLSGLARCTECGGAMTYAISGGGGRGARAYHYYRCWRSGRVAEGQGRERCTHRTFYPLVALDDAAWKAVGDLLTQPDQVRALLTQDAPPADHAARLGAIRTEMAALLSRAARFDLPDDVVEASLEPLQQERARLEAEQTTPPSRTCRRTCCAPARTSPSA